MTAVDFLAAHVTFFFSSLIDVLYLKATHNFSRTQRPTPRPEASGPLIALINTMQNKNFAQ